MKLINYNNKFLPDIVFDNFIYSQLEKINSITHFDPAINVKEEDKCFTIEFAVPGKQKNDFLIEINHNHKKKPFAGSAIFIHLTKNYKPTKGCIALKEKDFLILLKLIKKKTKIKIL